MKVNTHEGYDIYEHVHRFAGWAASTASSQKGHRFSVEDGQKIIKAAGLREILCDPGCLPTKPEDMDVKHKQWRKNVINEAYRVKPSAKFNDGIAAKLINVYLKVGLVTVANCNNKSVAKGIAALHPPIDRQLLKGLRKSDEKSEEKADQKRAKFWKSKERKGAGWSNFNSKQYQAVIDKIREKLGPEMPLWMIEEHWKGFQG